MRANDLVKQLAAAVEGRGGGKPDLAQGSGKDSSGIDAALTHCGQRSPGPAEWIRRIGCRTGRRGPPGPGRRLGIDVGSVRIGVAASDPDGILATPVETVRQTAPQHLRRLVALVAELQAVEVIVGLPRTWPTAPARPPSTRSSWLTHWPAGLRRPGPNGRRTIDDRHRAALAAPGRGAGQRSA